MCPAKSTGTPLIARLQDWNAWSGTHARHGFPASLLHGTGGTHRDAYFLSSTCVRDVHVAREMYSARARSAHMRGESSCDVSHVSHVVTTPLFKCPRCVPDVSQCIPMCPTQMDRLERQAGAEAHLAGCSGT